MKIEYQCSNCGLNQFVIGDEWRTFVEILKELPYMKELLNTN